MTSGLFQYKVCEFARSAKFIALAGNTWNQLVQEIIEFAGLFRDHRVVKDGSEGVVP